MSILVSRADVFDSMFSLCTPQMDRKPLDAMECGQVMAQTMDVLEGIPVVTLYDDPDAVNRFLHHLVDPG